MNEIPAILKTAIPVAVAVLLAWPARGDVVSLLNGEVMMGEVTYFENGVFSGNFRGEGKTSVQQNKVKRISFVSGCKGKFTNTAGKTGTFSIVSYADGQFSVMKSTVATANIPADLIREIIFLGEDSTPRGKSRRTGSGKTSSASSPTAAFPTPEDESADKTQKSARGDTTGTSCSKTLFPVAEVFVERDVDTVYLAVFTQNGGSLEALGTLSLEPPEMTKEEKRAHDKLLELFVKMTSATDLGVTKAQYEDLLLELKTAYTIQRRALPATRFCRFQLQCILALTCYLKANEAWDQYFNSDEDGKEIIVIPTDVQALSHMDADIDWAPFKFEFGDEDEEAYAVPYDIVLSVYWRLADRLTQMMFDGIESKRNESVEHETVGKSGASSSIASRSRDGWYSAEDVSNEENISLDKQNAVRAAQNYLAVMPFSRTKLIEQLSEFDGFSLAAATYAASHCGADWNQQAKLCAQNYLDIMPFSRESLINQLVFDGFTQSQAEYGVHAAGY